MRSYKFGDNCFDILSLIAAVHVMLAHTCMHILAGGHGGELTGWFVLAPGPAVAALFAISGFLNAASYERSGGMKSYFIKRAAVIYPPLAAVIVLPALLYGMCALIELTPKTLARFLLLIPLGSDGNLVPAGSPPNGSLWTIFVQLQFYALTPFFIYVFKRLGKIKSLPIICVFLLVNICDVFVKDKLPHQFNYLCFKYVYIYLIGLYLGMFDDVAEKVIRKAPILCAVYAFVWLVLRLDVRFYKYWTYINPISGLLVPPTVIALAYSFGKHRIKYDISYGLMLWHMPAVVIVNKVMKIPYCIAGLGVTWFMAVLLAFFSCRMIEQPCGKLKSWLTEPKKA